GPPGPITVPKRTTLAVAVPPTWPAASLPAVGDHACFVAVLNHAQDPAPPPLPATDWAGFTAYVRDNNNIAWRNFDVVDVTADPNADPTLVRFLVTGAPRDHQLFDLHLLQDLPEGVDLWWQVPLALYGLVHHTILAKVTVQTRT